MDPIAKKMKVEEDYLDNFMWEPSRTTHTREMQEQELRLFGSSSYLKNLKLYGKLPFKNFGARLKYQKRHCPEFLWDEINTSDNKEMYREELRRQRQRRLGRRYHRDTAQRLGVIKPPLSSSSSSSDSEEPEPQSQRTIDAMKELQLRRQKRLETARQNFQPVQLLNVSIHHPCSIVRESGENVTAGTLEANLNGFRFSSKPFEIDVMYGDIKYAFTQDGDDDKNRDPLCHLHLHKPTMVGTEMTQNIQFRMVHNIEESKKRPAHDSDKFEMEQERSRDDRNKLMRNFSSRVDGIMHSFFSMRLKCESVNTKRGFYGEVHPEDSVPFSATFVFSWFTLIQLEHTPFTVATLEDIELVNLVEVGSGMEMINMTIVFKDFKREVLHINSIPKAKLISIKESLDLSKVKYYENKMDIPDWGSKLKEISDYPEKFIGDGGWKFLNVEASANYSDSSGDMYSIGSYSSVSSGYCTDEEGKEKKVECVNQTGNFSDSSVEKLANPNIPVSDLFVGFDEYSDKEPAKSSDSDPRTKEKKQFPLIRKKWTMAEGKRVMVSSDECESVPKIREKGEKKGTTQPKRGTAVRRSRKLVMSEGSSDEEYNGA